MKKENNLKPCPFCGGKARLKSSHGFNNVSCENCGTEYPVSFETRKRAAAVWNKRSIENELVEKIEKLEAEIKRLREALAFYAELDGNGIQLYGDMDSEALEFVDGASQPFGKIARDALKAGA